MVCKADFSENMFYRKFYLLQNAICTHTYIYIYTQWNSASTSTGCHSIGRVSGAAGWAVLVTHAFLKVSCRLLIIAITSLLQFFPWLKVIQFCLTCCHSPSLLFLFFCGALQLVGYVAPGQITESQIMEYRVRKGLSNRFSCLLYVGQDISLSCRCSKDCYDIDVRYERPSKAMQFCAARNQTNQWRHRNETVTPIALRNFNQHQTCLIITTITIFFPRNLPPHVGRICINKRNV